jgi:PAS domain S-box-containing protein
MRLALAAGGVVLLALLTWLLLRGIDTHASVYAEAERAIDDFTLAEASISRDALQARAGLLRNYDSLVAAEQAMENAVSRIRVHVEAENIDPKPVDRLAAAVAQYEELIERFKSGNSLRQNSLSYVSRLSTDPAFGALSDQFAPSTTALAAAVLHLSRDSSVENASSLRQQINRFEAQAPTDGPDGEAARALIAHARLLSDLLPDVDQTLRAIVAAPVRQPLEETRAILARAHADFEGTAQYSRLLLYLVSLILLIIAIRLGLWLRARTLKMRRLVDANIIGIFTFEVEGRIIEANDAFLQMVGYERADIATGRLRWTNLTAPKWRDRDERRWVTELQEAASLQPFETEYIRKDGSRVPVLFGAATIEQHGNQGVAFVLDLTERKRAEAEAHEIERRYGEAQLELAHANRVATMGQLTTSIAHEINQPIAGVLINAGTAQRRLARQPPNVEGASQAIDRLVKDANRAADIIGRSRELVRKAPARTDELEINEAISEVIRLTRSEVSKNGVRLQTRLAESLPTIHADRVQLQQVMLNLIMNAVEAMSQMSDGHRELLISTGIDAGSVLVAVRDSGPGLSELDIERVFEAFYTTKSAGLGMGLSICRSIVESHGGRMWAAANVPKGASFQFTVPIHSDRSNQPK